MERETHAPPIVQFTESTKEFAGKGVLESPKFKMAIAEIGRKLGSDQNPQAKDSAESLIRQGIGMIVSKVGLLPAFSNPQSRAEVIDKLKKDKVKGAWIDILANWDVQEDPFGVGVLIRCRQNDIEEIIAKADQTKDPNEKKQIEIQAEAIGKGQDLIINYYRNQVSSSATQIAA